MNVFRNPKNIFLLISYTFYFLISLYGAFWISDEFDRERQMFYAFFLIPSGVLLPYGLFLAPRYWLEENPQLFKILMSLIVVGNLWGSFLLINALTGAETVTYTRIMKSRVEQRSLRMAYRKGGLGALYRLRW